MECIDRNRQAKSELIVRAFERAARDLADLAQAIEHRMTVDVERGGGRLHVLSRRK